MATKRRTTTKKKKTNNLLSSFNLGSKKAWIVLAFALVAGFLLYRTFALEPGVPHKGTISSESPPSDHQHVITAAAGKFKATVETTSGEMGVLLKQGTQVIAEDKTYEPVPLKRNRKRYVIDTNVAAGTYTIEVFLTKEVKKGRDYTLTADWSKSTSTTPPEEDPPTTPPPTSAVGKLVYSVVGGTGATYVNEADLNGAQITGPAYVRFEHGSNALKDVTFYVDGNLNRTDATPAPYEMYPQANFTGSPQTVTAVATLSDGTKQTINASVNGGSSTPPTTNNPPATGITSPTSSNVNGTVTFAASATDADGVAKVEFLVNNNVIATDTTSPYSTNWDTKTVNNGSHTLGVRAYDTKGAFGVATKSVNVFNESTPTPDPVPQSGVCTGRTATGGVPADKLPGAACTGYLPGSTLRDCPRDITVSNQTFENCNFRNGVYIAPNVSNITFKNSLIRGNVSSDFADRNYTFIDVEIAVWSPGVSAFTPSAGITCIRCNIHHTSHGLYGDNLEVTDSYIHDLYGEGILEPCSHMTGALLYGGNVKIRHTNVVGVRSKDGEGCTSSAISIYTHGDWWPDVDNVLIENSYLESDGVYCLYGGNSPDDDPSNIVIRNNIFGAHKYDGRCSPVTSWLRQADGGIGNIWEGNKLDTGQPVGEPPSIQ